MAHYDVIFKNGTLVNHDGEGAGDIGVIDGRIAALGSLAADSADRSSIARACISCPASSTRRCISASRA